MMFSSNSTVSLSAGVVKPKVALAVVFRGDLEIQAKGFGMAKMKVAIRFGRESGVHPAAIIVGFQVFCDSGSDKVQRGWDVVLINHRYKAQNFSIDSLVPFWRGGNGNGGFSPGGTTDKGSTILRRCNCRRSAPTGGLGAVGGGVGPGSDFPAK
jgi:hypothetical protein